MELNKKQLKELRELSIPILRFIEKNCSESNIIICMESIDVIETNSKIIPDSCGNWW